MCVKPENKGVAKGKAKSMKKMAQHGERHGMAWQKVMHGTAEFKARPKARKK